MEVKQPRRAPRLTFGLEAQWVLQGPKVLQGVSGGVFEDGVPSFQAGCKGPLGQGPTDLAEGIYGSQLDLKVIILQQGDQMRCRFLVV